MAIQAKQGGQLAAEKRGGKGGGGRWEDRLFISASILHYLF